MFARHHLFVPGLVLATVMAATAAHAPLPLHSIHTAPPSVSIANTDPASADATTAAYERRPTMPALVIPGLPDTHIYPLHTKVHYTTVIELPVGDKILELLCGDKADWVLEGAANIAFLKPGMPGLRTNVNLITTAGHIYSFDVSEVSGTAIPPDEKVIVRPVATPHLLSNAVGQPSAGPAFVSATDYDALQQRLQNTVHLAGLAVQQDRQNVAEDMHFDYAFKSNNKLHVQAIWDDGKFTYIKLLPGAGETPALYELRNGHPDMTNFDYRNGVYTITHIMQAGYLQVGHVKVKFRKVK